MFRISQLPQLKVLFSYKLRAASPIRTAPRYVPTRADGKIKAWYTGPERLPKPPLFVFVDDKSAKSFGFPMPTRIPHSIYGIERFPSLSGRSPRNNYGRVF